MNRFVLLALLASCAQDGGKLPGCRSDKECGHEQRCEPKTGICIGFHLPLGPLAPDAASGDGGRRDAGTARD